MQPKGVAQRGWLGPTTFFLRFNKFSRGTGGVTKNKQSTAAVVLAIKTPHFPN